jgi:hypothetical protein
MRPEKKTPKPIITIAGEGLQNINIWFGAEGRYISREGCLSCHTSYEIGPPFSGLIRRTAPLSRLLRHTGGCRRYILIRILTGHHLVDSYDSQGNAEVILLPGSPRMRPQCTKYEV